MQSFLKESDKSFARLSDGTEIRRDPNQLENYIAYESDVSGEANTPITSFIHLRDDQPISGS